MRSVSLALITSAVLLVLSGCGGNGSNDGNGSNGSNGDPVDTSPNFHVLLADYGIGSRQNNAYLEVGLQRPLAASDVLSDFVFDEPCTTSTLVVQDGASGELVDGIRQGCSDESTLETLFTEDEISLRFPTLTDEGLPITSTDTDLVLSRIGPDVVDDKPAFSSGAILLDFDSTDPLKQGALYRHAISAQESADATAQDLEGSWGIVRLELNLANDILYSANSVAVELTASADDEITVAFTNSTEVELIHFTDVNTSLLGRFFNQVEDVDDFPIAVQSNGAMVADFGFDDDENLERQLAGFLAPNADFFVLSQSTPLLDQVREDVAPGAASFGIVDHQWIWAVRRSEEPRADVSGKRYRLIGPAFNVETGEFALTPLAEGAFISFNADGTMTDDSAFPIDTRTVSFAGAAVSADTDQLLASLGQQSFIVSDAPGREGLLEFIAEDPRDDADGAGEFLTGFVQTGGNMVTLLYGRVGESDPADEEDDMERFDVTAGGPIAVMFAICETGC